MKVVVFAALVTIAHAGIVIVSSAMATPLYSAIVRPERMGRSFGDRQLKGLGPTVLPSVSLYPHGYVESSIICA